MPVTVFYPAVKELFDAVQEIVHPQQYILALRVFRDFLALCPDEIKLSEYLGHSNVNQTLIYLHTDALQMKEAVRRRDENRQRKTDVEKNLRSIYDEVQSGKISADEFVEKVSKFINFSVRVGQMTE